MTRTSISQRDGNRFEPSPDAIDLEDLLTIEEAAERLGMWPGNVKRMAARLGLGRTTSYRHPHYLSREDLRRIQAERRKQPPARHNQGCPDLDRCVWGCRVQGREAL